MISITVVITSSWGTAAGPLNSFFLAQTSPEEIRGNQKEYQVNRWRQALPAPWLGLGQGELSLEAKAVSRAVLSLGL